MSPPSQPAPTASAKWYDWPMDALRDAAAAALDYAASVDSRPAFPTPDAIAGLAAFDEPLPESGADVAETLRLLDTAGTPATVASTADRYFGFVIGGVHPAALGAAWLADAWDQNAALPVMSPVAARLHDVVRRWLVELLRLPEPTGVVFTTGATVANATCLAAARDALLERAGWDVQADGLFGAPPVTVVVGAHRHSTLSKSLGLVGLGRRRVIVVPADDQGRLRAEELPDVTGPVLVCAQAGEVNSGAFDPFDEIADWAAARDAPGSTSTAPSGSGRSPTRRAPSWSRASTAPTRGRPTGTSGSTSPTTAGSRSSGSRPRCAVPSPLSPATCRTATPRSRRCTTRRSRPSGHARSRCGRCCARSAGPVWPTWSSAPATPRSPSPTCCGTAASRCSTTSSSTRSWCASTTTPRPTRWSRRSRTTAGSGAAPRSGRTVPRCGSACRRGSRLRRTLRRSPG